MLDDDGAYRLQAAAGPHRVAIVAYAADDAPAGEMPATMRPRTSLIPGKYANTTTSGLAVVIAAGEKNTCDFQLE